VILTTLLHQQAAPTDTNIVVPAPETDSEVDFVNRVVTPIVVQLINNDVLPAIPTCTFPQG